MDDIYRIVSLPEDVDKKDWHNFVDSHPRGSIFQTYEMRVVYERTKNYEPISLAAIDNDGEIIALVQAAVMREMKGFLGSFSTRSVIQGGPLFVEGARGQKAVSLLMGEYDKIVRKRVVYSEIRNVYDMSEFQSLFRQMGYVYEDHLNYLIDLNRPEAEVWMSIHRSMRKNIKRSKRNGVLVRDARNESQVKKFYGFLEDVYHNAKVPLEDLSHFEAILDILVPLGMATFHLAKRDGEYIGGRVTLIYKGVVYAYSVGVPNKYRYLYPNALLNWELMQWGAGNGCHTFDFGGAGKPDTEYGVREFKRQFGGKLVNYGRFRKTHSPVKMRIAEKGFKVYRKVVI